MNTYRISRRSKYYPERSFEVAGQIRAIDETAALVAMKQRLRDRAADFEYSIEVVS